MYYKVVTKENKSLGLRNNPNIMDFPVGTWVFEPSPKTGKSDDGGIWCTHTLSNAKKLAKYMEGKHGTLTRIFSCEVGEVLYSNSYRVKTDGVRLVAEIHL